MIFSESLKKNKDFQTVYQDGTSQANRYLVMYVLSNQYNKNRLGIQVSKKVGNSVVRHRTKRLIKECYRLREDMLNSGFNIVVVARPFAAKADHDKIEGALIHLLKKHGIIKIEK